MSQVYFNESPIDCALWSLCRKAAPVLVAMSLSLFGLSVSVVTAAVVWHMRTGGTDYWRPESNV